MRIVDSLKEILAEGSGLLAFFGKRGFLAILQLFLGQLITLGPVVLFAAKFFSPTVKFRLVLDYKWRPFLGPFNLNLERRQILAGAISLV